MTISCHKLGALPTKICLACFWCSTAADSMHHGCFPQSYNEEHQQHGQVPSCLGAIFSFSHHTHTVKNVMLKIPILANIQRSLSTWKNIHSLQEKIFL